MRKSKQVTFSQEQNPVWVETTIVSQQFLMAKLVQIYVEGVSQTQLHNELTTCKIKLMHLAATQYSLPL